jgi:hypothetical protein
LFFYLEVITKILRASFSIFLEMADLHQKDLKEGMRVIYNPVGVGSKS